MILTNDFFSTVGTDRTDGVCRYTVRFNPAHPIFSVHFPNNPVTPGACLLQMATELLEQEQGRRLRLDTAKSIKFKHTITPDVEPTFVFTQLRQTEGQVAVKVSVEDGDTLYASLSLQFHTA